MHYHADTPLAAMPNLRIPKREAPKDVWLTRIPTWLYTAITTLSDDGNDDDQIHLGEVQAFMTTGGIDNTKPMRMFFNDKWRSKTNLPSAFELAPTLSDKATETIMANTYVFSEKELKGYPTHIKGGRVQKPSKFKKTVPKQTYLVGHATRQYNAVPLETPEYKDFNAKRIRQALQGSHTTTVMVTGNEVTDFKNEVHLNDQFGNFNTSHVKPKAQSNKAARVARADLIDMLHSCFDEYQHWPMKQLKARTQQPEQYLKDVLPELADLVKSGPFANTWKRHDIFDQQRGTDQEQRGTLQEHAASGDEEML